MAKVRAIHVPPELYGKSHAVPIHALQEGSSVRRWAETTPIGKEMLTFTIVEVDEGTVDIVGDRAFYLADDAIREYKRLNPGQGQSSGTTTTKV